MGKKVKPPENPDPRVQEIIADTHEEFMDVCRRQREGEFIIYRIAVGKHNAQYIFGLRYEKPYSPQIDLL